jgi:hypothetical protein
MDDTDNAVIIAILIKAMLVTRRAIAVFYLTVQKTN